jgi:diaminobutyrate-2-oxoglutarate transaminase
VISIVALPLGHNHPFVMERVRQFLDSGHIQQGLDITAIAKAEFVERLFDTLLRAFAAEAKSQFCGPSGSDAVEAAIKLFKTATGRRSVLTFHGGYHGMTMAALSLMGDLNPKQNVSGYMPEVHFMPYPYAYRCPFGRRWRGRRAIFAQLYRVRAERPE